MFLGLTGSGTNNFAYSWGLLYILCATRYFYDQMRLGCLERTYPVEIDEIEGEYSKG